MCLGVPGKVVSVGAGDPLLRTGRVSFGGVLREVSLAYVPEASPGDYVVVHAGFAISKMDEQEAGRVFAYLQELEGPGELEGAGP